VPAPPRTHQLLDQNAELAARLKVSEASLQQLREAHEQLQAEHRQSIERKRLLEEEVRWLKGQLYGRSSERLTDSGVSADQKMLFNEAEVLAAIEAAEALDAQRTTIIAAHERKARPHSGGREPIPAHLPRREILHDPPAHEKWCQHEHEGMCWARQRIGEEVSERYHFEPAKVWIERHVYPKYACEHCHQGVTVAAAIKNILPKSNASASLLAHVVTSKFDDGLPIFRICRQLERQEVRLSPGTLGTWVNTVGSETVVPLINLMNDDLLAESLVQMDETYLQVLQSEKAPSSEHYMVVRAAGPPGRRIVLFTYAPSRTAAALKDLLIGSDGPFRGKLLTDGLELYDIVTESLGLQHFGCLQHCRTYYHKALKVTELPSGRALAKVAMEDYLGKVFKTERDLKDLREERARTGGTLELDEILKLRREKSAPVLAAFRRWVEDLLPGVPPQSALGKALAYTTKQWPKLVRHLEHPDVPAHNNYIENLIRPFSQGRRVWLFANNPLGARASANLYSLVATARANGLEPCAYLNFLFENLPAAETVEALEALLPWNARTSLPTIRRAA
jgi:transposase/DNA-binding transcriptional regulator YdaS (Cro superfamily)